MSGPLTNVPVLTIRSLDKDLPLNLRLVFTKNRHLSTWWDDPYTGVYYSSTLCEEKKGVGKIIRNSCTVPVPGRRLSRIGSYIRRHHSIISNSTPKESTTESKVSSSSKVLTVGTYLTDGKKRKKPSNLLRNLPCVFVKEENVCSFPCLTVEIFLDVDFNQDIKG